MLSLPDVLVRIRSLTVISAFRAASALRAFKIATFSAANPETRESTSAMRAASDSA
jgi:hypothetical protein